MAAVVLLICTTTAAAQDVSKDRAFRQEVVQLTTDDGRIVPTLITFPVQGMNLNMPAIVHCQGGPGASPLEGSGPWIAAGLAAKGYTVIAPMIRHGERLFDTDFDDYDKDVKSAVDRLSSMGFRQIVLTGSSFGSITSTRYLVDTKDPRINATIHFAPTEDMGYWNRRGMGDQAFFERNAEAGAMISRNQTDELFAPRFDSPPPAPPGRKVAFYSTPEKWIKLWGIATTGANLQLFPKLTVPILMLAGEKDGYNTLERMGRLKAAATASPKVDILFYPGDVDHSFNSTPPVQPKVVDDVVAWLTSIGLGPRPRVRTEVITITDVEPGTRAFRYTADAAAPATTAFLTVHDMAGSAFTGPPNWIAEGVAQAGNVAIGIHINRGSRGILSATYTAASKEIGNWVDYLQKKGMTKIVLVGHGVGATRVTQYLASTRDPRVGGVVLVAPAPDAAAYLRGKLGAAAYDAAVAKARAKPDSEDYRDIVYLHDAPAGVPIVIGRTTFAMEPAAFLANWGPDAPRMKDALARIDVPVLVLAGAADGLLQPGEVDGWTRGARKVDVTWYKDGDHQLAGSETRATADILRWAAEHRLTARTASAATTTVSAGSGAAR